MKFDDRNSTFDEIRSPEAFQFRH